MLKHGHKDTGSNKRPRLIFLVPSLAGGGAEKTASTLLPYLVQAFDVTLALLENRRTYPVPDKLRVVAFSGRLDSRAAHLVRIPCHVMAMVQLVRKRQPGVVLSFMEQANIINLLSSCITGHRAVISQRIEPYRQHAGKGLLGRLILHASRLFYPMASQVIAVSAGIRRVLVGRYGLAPERVTVIHNPVHLESLRDQSMSLPPAGIPQRFILHVGRISLTAKAQDVIIEAFHILHQRHTDLSLVLVGEGPDRRRVKRQVHDLSLENAVVLAGWQDNVAAFMSRAEVFVLASRYEGWPNALAEAMACGCPVVATDCETGPREMLGDSEYGLLTPVDDPEAVAHSVERLLTDKSGREYFQKQARKRSQDFGIEYIGPEYVRVLRNKEGPKMRCENEESLISSPFLRKVVETSMQVCVATLRGTYFVLFNKSL
jgi:N-acetylgalactosamine-N,N'-diacetylbacillosaminyl-diphospho-undecaprenol 4-alpha-N-acetylgalactosaminyltransferase